MKIEDLGNRKPLRRNPRLADLMERANLAEKMGTGINRMKTLMEEKGLPEPRFEENSNFKVTLIGEKEPDLDLSNADLNERQKEALKITYKKQSITNSDYQDHFEVSSNTAWNDLKDMVEKGFLEKKGKTRSVRYVFKEDN